MQKVKPRGELSLRGVRLADARHPSGTDLRQHADALGPRFLSRVLEEGSQARGLA